MGWTGDFASKAEAIAHTTQNNVGTSRKLLASKSTRQAWYGVVEYATGERYIAVSIFEGRAPCILVKEMDEGMGPSGCTDCPLQFLDMVPSPGGYADGWRDCVRAYWAAK